MAVSSRPRSGGGVNVVTGQVQRVASGASSQHRKPSPLRQSFRMTEDGLVEDTSPKPEVASESEFHMSLQYKELYRHVLTEVKINMDECAHYKHKERLLDLIPSFALIIPLIASVLVTINANYKNVGLAIAAGVVGASATCIIGLVNGMKNNLKFAQTAQFYHDKAGKLKEIQDHLSFAINLRQYESMDFYEHSSRFQLLKDLPVGSDITGTAAAANERDDISEFLRTNTNNTPITSIPKALETKILQTHYASSAKAGYTATSPRSAATSSPTSSVRSRLSNHIRPSRRSEKAAAEIEADETPPQDLSSFTMHHHSTPRTMMIRPSPLIHSER